MSISRGFSIAERTASGVISWNTTRLTGLSCGFVAATRCQAIASPSRSGSVARISSLACSTDSLSSLTSLDLSRGIEYFGVKSCSSSTPVVLLGRSRMWPLEAVTEEPLTRYRSIVRALAGDSTITRRPFDFARDVEPRLALVVVFVVFLVVCVPELPVLEVGIREVSIHYQ